MMNRGLMKRQMFARGGPVRMQQGGLAGISSSLQNANQSLGTAQQQLQQAIGGNGGMGSPMGGIMGIPNRPRPMFGDQTMAEVVGNPMGKIGAIQRQLAAPVGMAEGGAAFPDLTGDGKVTYADILKGRGVEMQMGGEPMAAQQAAMMQAPMPQDPSMESAAAEATKMGINPSDVEGMLNQVSEGIGNLDDAEDFEQVINSMRGDEAPLSERYGELAELVGEEDARATPESVLTLVQPIVQIAQIDQGIGGLAQEEMSAPVEGNMAGGIMSTVNMGEEVPAPVNFNQGGPVVAMNTGGVASGAAAYMPQFRDLYTSVLGDPAERAADLEKQRDLTKAQMLFDIAQAGLQFAGTTQGGSIAERLANAVSTSGVLPRIGERAAQLEATKQAQEKEERGLELAALQSSIAASQADETARQALERAIASKSATTTSPDFKRIVAEDGTNLGTFDVKNEKDNLAFKKILAENPTATAYNLSTQPSQSDFKTIKLYDPKNPTTVTEYPINTAAERSVVANLLEKGLTSDNTLFAESIKAEVELGNLTATLTIKDEFLQLAEKRAENRELTRYERNRKDELDDIDNAILAEIEKEKRALNRELTREERDRIEFNRRFEMEVNSQVEKERRALGRDLSKEEREAIEYRARLLEQEKVTIRAEIRAIANRDNIEVRTIDGQIVAVNKKTNETTVLFGEKKEPPKEYRQITLPDAQGTPRTTVVDINTPAGQAAIAKINEVVAAGGQASMQKVPTANIRPKAYLIPELGVFTSFDGGKTYVNEEGETQLVPGGALPISDTTSYEVYKNEKIRAAAIKELEEMDALIITGMTDENGAPLNTENMLEVKDAYEAARKGTGFWAKVLAGVDAAVGGVTGGYFTVAEGKQDARQFVRMLRVMGRSALAASPRFAVADLATTEQLFPNEQSLIANPVTEARKLFSLKTALLEEKRRINELYASDEPIDSTLRKTLNQKLFEIERLNNMLGPLDTIYQTETTQEAKKSAMDLIRSGVVKKN